MLGEMLRNLRMWRGNATRNGSLDGPLLEPAETEQNPTIPNVTEDKLELYKSPKFKK